MHTHLAQVKEVGDELGIGMLGLGLIRNGLEMKSPGCQRPIFHNEAMDARSRDTRARHDAANCTVQTNLDFSHEADMVQKYRISIALQPLATALFANSPFQEGGVSNCLSLRSNVWTDTDPYRCGMLLFVFEEGYGFERHVDYILDVPMYFVYRDGIYHDVAGKVLGILWRVN